jgi:hypothetical protein
MAHEGDPCRGKTRMPHWVHWVAGSEEAVGTGAAGVYGFPFGVTDEIIRAVTGTIKVTL